MGSSLREFLGEQDAPSYDKLAESELAERAKHGDRDAADLLIRSQAHWIFKICAKIEKPEGVSTDELFSNVVGDCARSLQLYDPSKARLTSFLHRVVVRKSKNYFKRMNSGHGHIVHRQQYINPETNENCIDILDSAETERQHYSDIDDLCEVIRSIMDTLDDRSRFIIELRADGKTFAEIAASDTERNIELNLDARSTKASTIRDILFSIRRKILQEILRRDIAIDHILSESKLPNVFDDLMSV